ncbi:MAG: TPM domain-containing protein [Nitrospinae bacterium]|nr:TPM domain-containing protein [Nitrospinota bacterium]
MRRFPLTLALAAALWAVPAFAALPAIPAPTGLVTDAAGILQPAQRNALDAELRAYEQQTGTEIAILIVKDTGGLEAWEYATNAGNQWGVGKKGVDNGALILVALDTHDFWIAAGRQLEGAVTDAEAGAIFREMVRPRFRTGDFYGGLKAAVEGTKQAIAGEIFTDKRMGRKSGRGKTNYWDIFGILFPFGIILISWLAAVLGRSKAWWPGGLIGAGGGALVAFFFGLSLLLIGVIAVALGLAGLAFDYVVSKSYKDYRGGGPTPPWFMGGGGFSGGGGGFGGGGSFGGGGFSGGGGGGKW